MKESKTKKKVIFVISRLVQGGAEMILINDINNLDKNYFQCYLCTLAPELELSLMEKVKLPDEQKCMINFQSRYDIRSWFKLILWLKKERFDIMYTYVFPAHFIGRIAGKIAGIPSIIISELSVYTNRSTKARVVNFILGIFTTRLVANSYSVKKYLVEKEKISENKIEVIYNGVDLKKFSFDEKKREDYRKKFKLSKDDIVVISVGRVMPVKGTDLLVDTVYELRKREKKNIYFYIAGMTDNGFADSLKVKVKKLKISSRIHFLGPRDDISDLLNMADIFFMPSRREGFPNALLEAMAVGLAPVVSNLGPFQEALDKGRYGLIGSSVSEFASHIDKLASDVNLIHHYRLLARERVKKFDLDLHIKKTENLFLELTKE